MKTNKNMKMKNDRSLQDDFFIKEQQDSYFEELKLECDVPPAEVSRAATSLGHEKSGKLESLAAAPNLSKRVESDLSLLREAVCCCENCRLGKTRIRAVFGSGNPEADLMFIGEAPGAREDESGEPFVGPAGKVLSEELRKNGIAREDVFICNIVKCRPPQNRDPLPDEIAACEPYLLNQIDLIKPKLLCGLGRHAVQTLLKREISIMKIRGSWLDYHGVPLFVCLHPSATLHQRSTRASFDQDIAVLAEAYHKARSEKQ
jgi:DNA polymerase